MTHEFEGMGSQPAKAAALARHRGLLADPTSGPSHPDAERQMMLAAAHGDPLAAVERLADGAWSDIDRERQRHAANAPAVQAEIDAIRDYNDQRAARRAQLAAQQPEDRITPQEGSTGGSGFVPGRGGWEELAARAHAEARRLTVGDGPVARFDPDDQDEVKDGVLLARYGDRIA